MNSIDKEALIAKVKELIAVPYCCGELKDAGKVWLDALCTESEKDAAEALVKELEEDVMPIDGLIAFAGSPVAAEKLGKEAADAMLQDALAAKAQGDRYCTCEACRAGAFILDNKALLF